MRNRRRSGSSPQTPRPPPWWRRQWKVLAGVLATVLTGVLTTALTGALDAGVSRVRSAVFGAPAVSLPLSATVEVNGYATCANYAVGRPPSDMPPAPADPSAFHAWATQLGGVSLSAMTLKLTLHGRSPNAVVLHGLTVTVTKRTSPPSHETYGLESGCGASVSPRIFSIGLDSATPKVRAIAGEDASGAVIPAVGFPYRISETEPEVFVIRAETDRLLVDWHLGLRWSSDGRDGELVINDRGRDFRIAPRPQGIHPNWVYNRGDIPGSPVGWVRI
jgi:hypothetical protein